jgi:hypothetical protein
LVKLFERRDCAHAKECADETFNRVTQKIGKGASSIWTDEPYSYFHGVVIDVWREYLICTSSPLPPFSRDHHAHGQGLTIAWLTEGGLARSLSFSAVVVENAPMPHYNSRRPCGKLPSRDICNTVITPLTSSTVGLPGLLKIS